MNPLDLIFFFSQPISPDISAVPLFFYERDTTWLTWYFSQPSQTLSSFRPSQRFNWDTYLIESQGILKVYREMNEKGFCFLSIFEGKKAWDAFEKVCACAFWIFKNSYESELFWLIEAITFSELAKFKVVFILVEVC